MEHAREEPFASLRHLLYQSPSPQGWRSICEMMMVWPEGEEREVALSYAAEHLHTWPAEMRVLTDLELDSVMWPLAGGLALYLDLSPGLEKLARSPHITFLNISLHPEGGELAPLAHAGHLTHLQIYYPEPAHLYLLRSLQSLDTLHITGGPRLFSLSFLEDLPSLAHLVLSHFPAIVDLDDLAFCQQLRSLECHHWRGLRNIEALTTFQSLERLSLNVGWLEALAPIASLRNLRQLRLSKQAKIEQVQSLFWPGHPLSSLSLEHCSSLRHLEGCEQLNALTTLQLAYCYHLEDVSALAHLEALSVLDMRSCTGLFQPPKLPWMSTREEVAAYQEELRDGVT